MPNALQQDYTAAEKKALPFTLFSDNKTPSNSVFSQQNVTVTLLYCQGKQKIEEKRGSKKTKSKIRKAAI